MKDLETAKRDYTLWKAKGDAVREAREMLLNSPQVVPLCDQEARTAIGKVLRELEDRHRMMQGGAADAVADQVCR